MGIERHEVMEYDAITGETTYRDWTDEERAENAARESEGDSEE